MKSSNILSETDMRPEIHRLKAIASAKPARTKVLAASPKEAIEYVKRALDDCDMQDYGMKVKLEDDDTIVITGKLFKPGDIVVDLYLTPKGKGATVAVFFRDLPVISFDAYSVLMEGDFKKSKDVKKLRALFDKAGNEMLEAGPKTEAYGELLLRFEEFISRVSKDIE